MSNMLIVMQKAKCGKERKQKLIKISEMLKKPLNKLKVNKNIKSSYNSANPLSMFLEPIDQQYSEPPPDENSDTACLVGEFDILNYSTDSFSDFPKVTKNYQSSINFGRTESKITNCLGLTSMVNKGLTSIKDFLKNPLHTSNGNSFNGRRLHSYNNIIFNIKNKNKFTKLLHTEWESRIIFDKNKSLQKLLLHNEVQSIKIEKNSKRKIHLNYKENSKNVPRKYTKYINNTDNNSNNKIPFTINNYNVNEKIVNNLIKTNKNDIKAINNNFNFSNNNLLQYFPINKECDYEHVLKERIIINKFKNRRPLSVE